MNRLACLAIVTTMLMQAVLPASAEETPVPFIFDTDMGNDCDDVLAMGVIHALQTRRECQLVAVTLTKDHALAAPFIDVVNTFYGRGEIPIGVCHSGVTPEPGKFNVLAETKDGDQFRYPHDLQSGTMAPAAVTVLRQALASQPDGSVVIAQVGFSTNLADLLKSSPDDISDLNGLALVRKKVRLLSVMAGTFVRNTDKLRDHKEYNVIKDIPSAQRVAEEWPTPILWSGYEIGLALPYPHESIDLDYGYVKHHPLAEAYLLYCPPQHNRPTWDLTSVLQAIRPDHGYFDLSPPGRVTIADDGLTRFEPTPDGRDRYLILQDHQQARTLEALVQLSSQPPE